MKRIKLLTQNNFIPRFWDRKKRMGEINKQAKPYDILCLQEILFSSTVRPLEENFVLSYTKGRFGPRGGLVTASKEKPKKILFEKFKKQGNIISLEIFDRIIEKGILTTRFKNFTLINTHIIINDVSKKNFGKSPRNMSQLKQLIKVIKKEKKRKNKIILAGDLNFNNKSEQYQQLTRILNDNTKRLGKKSWWSKKLQQIDFIFSTNPVVKNARVQKYNRYVSDHPGIYAEF